MDMTARPHFSQVLLRSSALFEIFEFLGTLEKTMMQGVSKVFYDKIVPRCLQLSPLSIYTKETLFSYSVDQGSILFKFHIPTRQWEAISQASSSPFFHFNYSMQVVVTSYSNRVFLLGGSTTPENDDPSPQVLKWDARTNELALGSPMLQPLVDFGACQAGPYIYCAGGYESIKEFTRNEDTYVYHIGGNRWLRLPQARLEGPQRTVCSLVNISNRAIYGLFNLKREFFKLDLTDAMDQQRWERLTVKEDLPERLWMCAFQVPQKE
jgi:hypothetical protein